MLLPLIAVGFITINNAKINPEQIVALGATDDKKQCQVHLLTKNPFTVNEPCEAIIKRVKDSQDSTTGMVLAGLGGLAVGSAGGYTLARKKKQGGQKECQISI